MAKQLLTLICETCGRKFEAHARRRVMHCQECGEELRRKGLGPVQIERRTSANPISSKIQAKEIAWERSESDLTYYLKRFNRFPTYDGVTPSDLDQITDEDRRIANKIAARMSAKTWAPIVGLSIAQVGDRVCMEPGVPDFKSKVAMLGLYNLDPTIKFWATLPDHGCLRESVVHPAMFTFKPPDNVSLAEEALVEPFAVGLHAAQKAGIRPRDVAVVMGAGTIGLLTGIAAMAGGCSTAT